jgi:hypothetical protein
LKEKYVERVSREQLIAWHIEVRSLTKECFYFAKSWLGLFSLFFPGYMCGSQPVESFHALWERVRLGFGGREDVQRILETMQKLYESDSAFTRIWNTTEQTSLICSHSANPDLLNGDCLRQAMLSPALDYFNTNCASHVVVAEGGFTVVAMQNSAREDTLPAEVAIDARLARLGARMLFAADSVLQGLLFEAGILYCTTGSAVNVSLSSFRAVFENIAYVILTPLPERWRVLGKPVCTCHIYGIQQQCQHSLFVEGMVPTFEQVSHPRDFSVAVSTRGRGRPKGKATPKAKRRLE